MWLKTNKYVFFIAFVWSFLFFQNLYDSSTMMPLLYWWETSESGPIRFVLSCINANNYRRVWLSLPLDGVGQWKSQIWVSTYDWSRGIASSLDWPQLIKGVLTFERGGDIQHPITFDSSCSDSCNGLYDMDMDMDM